AVRDALDGLGSLVEVGRDHEAREVLAVLVAGHRPEAEVMRGVVGARDLYRVAALEEEAPLREGGRVRQLRALADEALVVFGGQESAIGGGAVRLRRGGADQDAHAPADASVD